MKLLDKDEFDALPRNKQRVAIAQDVIARIDNAILAPIREHMFGSWRHLWTSIPLKDYLNNPDDTCTACAKGALVCSWIGNFNNYGWCDIIQFRTRITDSNTFPSELVDIFGVEQLDLIEAAFESVVYISHSFHKEYSSLDRPMCVGFDSSYAGDLLGIMQNIVDNDGEFVFEIPLEKN